MQETAIADGVGERLSLEGDPVFEAPQTPYKKMPSWGGMRQAGCATPDSIGYLGKRDLVGLRGNWWDW